MLTTTALSLRQVDQEHQDVDDVRHYNLQGDEMSAASLSSLASGSSRSDVLFDYKNDWGQRFEKLANIYRTDSDAEEDSEYEFPDIPNNPRSHLLCPEVTKIEPETTSTPNIQHIDDPQSPTVTGRNNTGPSASVNKKSADSKSADSPTPVILNKSKCESPVSSPTSKAKSNSLTSFENSKKAEPPSSLLNKHSVDPPPSLLINKYKVDPSSSHLTNEQNGDPQSSPLKSKHKVNQPPSPHINKRKLDPPSSPIRSRYNSDTPVTTINNLYKSPAQRSLAANRNSTLPRSSLETPRTAAANATATNTLGSRRSPVPKAGSGVATLKKKEYHETVNPMAAVQAVKGIETWC
ncbi:uncharacterized protein [Panulirus ornatus]|uniref:uncharacterized protein n=1 Tax=Panulirus ornatus TaxID=150431 RepID=UPI003A84226F